jgi:class 3 adenylate cyclase
VFGERANGSATAIMLKSTSPPWSAVGAPTTAALNNYNTNRHPFAKKLCYHSSVEHRAGFKEDLVQDLEDWLTSIGLSEYTRHFAEGRVDASIVRYLTNQDLKELGIPLGGRKRILRAIEELEEGRLGCSAGTQSATGERRQVTVMFCDLTDSTALSSRLDPEDLREVIKAYRSVCAHVISNYDGFIAQFLGDGILAYFGFPQAHENDAERAVRAGLDIVSAIPRMQLAISETLTARVGVATGLVVVGDLVSPGAPKDSTVVGDTPNIAARLQSLANPSSVVISGSTHRLTAGHFEYTDLGHVTLKGLKDPVEAWQVLGLSSVESRFEAEHGLSLPSLLGREEEVELLSRRWRQAAQGEGRVVLLTGEPGIGKSHIVLDFQKLLLKEPHSTLRYFCSVHHTNSALFPFISQLERSAAFERGDSPAQRYAKLQAMLGLSPSLVPPLGNLLSLSPHDSALSHELSPRKRKQSTLSALLALLKSTVEQSPVLIVFEDVHWIDPTSLELLTAIVQEAPQLPLLVLITARPEFIPPGLIMPMSRRSPLRA